MTSKNEGNTTNTAGEVKPELLSTTIEEVVTHLSEQWDAILYGKTEEELEKYWHFEYNNQQSQGTNIYYFSVAMRRYSRAVRRWEEHHNGTSCVVERVRDKYLLPKCWSFEDKVAEAKTYMAEALRWA